MGKTTSKSRSCSPPTPQADSCLLYYPDHDSDRMVLGVDHRFEVDGLEIWIPRGYRFDGASIPQFLWGIIGSRFEPDRLLAALRHDWAYLTHCATRKQADALFRADLHAAGVAAWKREAMYSAVRAFGGGSWPTSEADQAEINRVRAMLAGRDDRDKFLRMMIAA